MVNTKCVFDGDLNVNARLLSLRSVAERETKCTNTFILIIIIIISCHDDLLQSSQSSGHHVTIKKKKLVFISFLPTAWTTTPATSLDHLTKISNDNMMWQMHWKWFYQSIIHSRWSSNNNNNNGKSLTNVITSFIDIMHEVDLSPLSFFPNQKWFLGIQVLHSYDVPSSSSSLLLWLLLVYNYNDVLIQTLLKLALSAVEHFFLDSFQWTPHTRFFVLYGVSPLPSHTNVNIETVNVTIWKCSLQTH